MAILNAAVLSGLVASTEQALAGPGITIGGVGLTEMEVPDKLTWGGTQMLAVHKLIGGQRVIDAMGQDDRTLDWGGLMRGSSAVQRARQLDALRVSGARQVLTWADFTYTVVVQSFEADYTRQGYRVPYRISCIIIPQPPVPVKPSLLQSLGSDLSSALGIDGLSASLGGYVSLAQAALPVAAVLTGGGSAYIGISSAVGAASGAMSLASTAAGAQVGTQATAAGLLGHLVGGTDALSGIAALQSMGASTAQLATTTIANSYLGRAVANLAGASP